MKKLFFFCVIFIMVYGLFAQNTLSLTFKGQDQGNAYFQLDSVRVENLTREWAETIIYPDTEMILLVSVGVDDNDFWRDVLIVPNPFVGNAVLCVGNMQEGPARLKVTDVQGRLCAEYSGVVQSGTNAFAISLTTPQIYFVSIQTERGSKSCKLVNVGYGDANRIALVGHPDMESGQDYMKKQMFESEALFVLGDEMRYTGFATIEGEMRVSEIVTQEQMEDDTIALVFFQDGIPCSNMPTVTDHEGNVYPTIQVGPQCWTAQSMRALTSPTTGTYLLNVTPSQYSFSGKIARWYNNDSTTYAALNYGVLYNWNAVVDTFNTVSGETSVETASSQAVSAVFPDGRRGICPQGWHVPSNAEWSALVNYVKTKEEYFCNYSSLNVAKAFASTTGWTSNSSLCAAGNNMESNNALGFTAYPEGFFGNGAFSSLGMDSTFWTADQNTSDKGKTWGLYYNNSGVYPSSNSSKSYCYAVRCLRD